VKESRSGPIDRRGTTRRAYGASYLCSYASECLQTEKKKKKRREEKKRGSKQIEGDRQRNKDKGEPANEESWNLAMSFRKLSESFGRPVFGSSSTPYDFCSFVSVDDEDEEVIVFVVVEVVVVEVGRTEGVEGVVTVIVGVDVAEVGRVREGVDGVGVLTVVVVVEEEEVCGMTVLMEPRGEGVVGGADFGVVGSVGKGD
jgi:hypothetical protein